MREPSTLHNLGMRSQLPRTFRRAIRASLPVVVMLCALSAPARCDWTVATSAVASHDDNVGNGQSHSGKLADSDLSAGLSLLQLIPFGESFSLAAGGDLAGQIYDRLTGLNNASFNAVLSLKKKWGVGALAAWTRAGISAGRGNYDDGYRDATIYRASIEAGKRLDERFNLWAKYSFERRRADPVPSDLYRVSSDVFSSSGRSFKAGLQYALSERISLSAGSLLRHGDVVSTVQENATIYTSSRAVAPDPTFGPEAYAYRLYGTTFGARLGAEYSLTVHSLIGCGFQRLETHAQGGNNYADSVAEVTWNYRL
jgi:hypothetical protein